MVAFKTDRELEFEELKRDEPPEEETLEDGTAFPLNLNIADGFEFLMLFVQGREREVGLRIGRIEYYFFYSLDSRRSLPRQSLLPLYRICS